MEEKREREGERWGSEVESSMGRCSENDLIKSILDGVVVAVIRS